MTRPTDRQLAVAGIIVLLLAVLAVVADADGADRVDRLSQARLERAAERAASTGGIRSSRYADATPWMRRLARELVERAFPRGSRQTALCIVDRESGFNPGAISRTDDHGLPQINRPSHPWVNVRRIVVDPVYAVAVMVRLSHRGRDWGPWGWAC